MKETAIRNQDGSFKPEAIEISKKVDAFLEKILEEHPDMHPDDIQMIITNKTMGHCTMSLALRAE